MRFEEQIHPATFGNTVRYSVSIVNVLFHFQWSSHKAKKTQNYWYDMAFFVVHRIFRSNLQCVKRTLVTRKTHHIRKRSKYTYEAKKKIAVNGRKNDSKTWTTTTPTTNMWNLNSFVDYTPYKALSSIANALTHRIGTGHAYYAISFCRFLCMYAGFAFLFFFCTWLCILRCVLVGTCVSSDASVCLRIPSMLWAGVEFSMFVCLCLYVCECACVCVCVYMYIDVRASVGAKQSECITFCCRFNGKRIRRIWCVCKQVCVFEHTLVTFSLLWSY